MMCVCVCVQGVAVLEALPVEEGELFHYQPVLEDLLGPGVPEQEELAGYG